MLGIARVMGIVRTHINPLDLLALRDRDFERDWLVEKFWPNDAHLHIFATPKTGKSLLMLWIAANLALGRDAFTGQSIKRYRVAYVDNEMTEHGFARTVDRYGVAIRGTRGMVTLFLVSDVAALWIPS